MKASPHGIAACYSTSLYTLKDGGTFWGRQLNSDRNAPATLALLECFGYKLRASSSSP